MSDADTPSRRDFFRIAGGAALGAWLVPNSETVESWQGAAALALRFGYAAITWEGHDVQAIDDVAAVGFKGIQLRSPILEKFGDTPETLRDLLHKRQLMMVAMSSGNLRIDPTVEAEELAKHTHNAKFVKDVGGLYLQIIDEGPKRSVTAADYKRLGVLLSELGKRTATLGIPLIYHHHMNSLGERPEEISAILEATDPAHVKLLLDVAHYQQGGGDPVRAVRQYHDRIQLLHIKDVVSPAPGATGDVSRSYQFVELGRGTVDLKGVFAAIKEVGFAAGRSSSSTKCPIHRGRRRTARLSAATTCATRSASPSELTRRETPRRRSVHQLRTYLAGAFLVAVAVSALAARESRIQVTPNEAGRRVDITIDGKPFTSYIWPTTLKKPVLYPLRSAKGTIVTRGFPLEPRPGERVDHPHHAGLWFNYGDVNGLDFWNNSDAIPTEQGSKMGTILHRRIVEAQGRRRSGELTVEMEWVAADGKPLLREHTQFVFRGDGDVADASIASRP